jgi:hypothetical protein
MRWLRTALSECSDGSETASTRTIASILRGARCQRSPRRPRATARRRGANRRRASRRSPARSELVLPSPPYQPVRRRRDTKDEDQMRSILQRDVTGLSYPRKARVFGLGPCSTKAKALVGRRGDVVERLRLLSVAGRLTAAGSDDLTWVLARCQTGVVGQRRHSRRDGPADSAAAGWFGCPQDNRGRVGQCGRSHGAELLRGPNLQVDRPRRPAARARARD